MTAIQGELTKRGLSQIPSEFIEPYLVAMLSIELECIAFTFTEEQLEQSKANLKGIERFVSRFCGIHASIATGNVYYDFYRMTLEDVKKIINNS